MGDEAGFSLIEVLVALVVLLVILLPVGDLLLTSSQVIANGKFRTQAQGVAQQEVAAVQAMADNCSATTQACDGASHGFAEPFTNAIAASGGAPAVTPTTVSNGVASWNSATPGVPVTADNEHYHAYVDGNWCTAPSGTGSLGTGASSSAGTLDFVVAVAVTWDHTTLTSGYTPGTHVVVTSVVLPPAGWSGVSYPTGPLSGCPAGLR